MFSTWIAGEVGYCNLWTNDSRNSETVDYETDGIKPIWSHKSKVKIFKNTGNGIRFVNVAKALPSKEWQQSLPANNYEETLCVLIRMQKAMRQVVSKDSSQFNGNPEDWPLFFFFFNSSTQMWRFLSA